MMNIEGKISEIGNLWRNSQHNIILDREIVDRWDSVIRLWAEDPEMPLIIRKSAKRGTVGYNSGRKLIFSDNTFALWVFGQAREGHVYSVNEFRDMLESNSIPMVYISSKKEAEERYKKPLGKNPIEGYKLCHIEPVGLKTRNVESLPLDTLKEYFIRYASPQNMFVVPLALSGLGEVKEFIDAQRPAPLPE